MAIAILLQAQRSASTDLAIGVVTQLFILSMINERIATFVKLQMYDADNWFSRFFGMFSRKWRTRFVINPKTDDPESERVRERTILIINLTLGFLIALALKADLKSIMTSGSEKIVLGWDGYSLQPFFWDGLIRLFSILFGCLLTGSFISLGSKFWHDLLDAVLSVSNLKSKLTDPRSYAGKTADEVEEFIAKTAEEIANLALEQNRSKYEPYTDHIGFGRNSEGQLCIYLHAKEGDANYTALKKLRLYTKLPNSGRIVEQPSVAVKYMEEKIVPAGASAWDIIAGNTRGTICCKVKDTFTNIEYLMTCSHVVYDDNGKPGSGNISNPIPVQLSYPGGGHFASTCRYALRNALFDVALVAVPQDSKNTFNNIPGLIVDAPVSFTGYFGKKVQILTHDNYEKTGYLIEEVPEDVVIEYKDGEAKMNFLLRIGSVPGLEDAASSAVTTPGDSGSLVYYQDGKKKIPIAMIIAASKRYSYAVPMYSNLDQTSSIIS